MPDFFSSNVIAYIIGKFNCPTEGNNRTPWKYWNCWYMHCVSGCYDWHFQLSTHQNHIHLKQTVWLNTQRAPHFHSQILDYAALRRMPWIYCRSYNYLLTWMGIYDAFDSVLYHKSRKHSRQAACVLIHLLSFIAYTCFCSKFHFADFNSCVSASLNVPFCQLAQTHYGHG